MPFKTSFILAGSLAIAALAGSLGTVGAAAAGGKPSAGPAYRLHRAAAVHHWHYVARHSFGSVYGYVGAAPFARGFSYDAPRRIDGYIYLPGRGILDAACDLPTSACPNGERDVQ